MSRKRTTINMLGAKRDGCEVIGRDGTSAGGEATWFVRCECGDTRSAIGRGLRETHRSWKCGKCYRESKLPAIGTVIKSWRVVAADASGRLVVTAECVHCGVTRTMRVDSISTWHNGCSAPRPDMGRSKSFMSGGKFGLPGSHPSWAKWSSELDADPTLRATWPPAQLEAVEMWRSNLRAASRRVSVEEIASSRRAVMW